MADKKFAYKKVNLFGDILFEQANRRWISLTSSQFQDATTKFENLYPSQQGPSSYRIVATNFLDEQITKSHSK